MINRIKSLILPRMTTRKMTFEEFNALQKRQAAERHEPIIRAYLSGKTEQQIADEIGKSKGRVSQIIVKARKEGRLPQKTR